MRRVLANLNHVTTPVGHSVAPEQTITVIDPRHPLCGRTLTLVAMTHHATLGRCCVVWLRPHIERLVPVRATNLEFDPNDLSPSPLSLAAVEQLLRVVHDIEHASERSPQRCQPTPPERRLHPSPTARLPPTSSGGACPVSQQQHVRTVLIRVAQHVVASLPPHPPL